MCSPELHPSQLSNSLPAALCSACLKIAPRWAQDVNLSLEENTCEPFGRASPPDAIVARYSPDATPAADPGTPRTNFGFWATSRLR